MEHIRVLTMSLAQSGPEDTPELHLRAVHKGRPELDLALVVTLDAIPYGTSLEDWVKNALLAAVDEL